MSLPEACNAGPCRPGSCLPVTCLELLQTRTSHSQRASPSPAPQSLVIRPCILATKSSLAEELIHLPSASLTPFKWEIRGIQLPLWWPGKPGEGRNYHPMPCPLDHLWEPRPQGPAGKEDTSPKGTEKGHWVPHVLHRAPGRGLWVSVLSLPSSS